MSYQSAALKAKRLTFSSTPLAEEAAGEGAAELRADSVFAFSRAAASSNKYGIE